VLNDGNTCLDNGYDYTGQIKNIQNIIILNNNSIDIIWENLNPRRW